MITHPHTPRLGGWVEGAGQGACLCSNEKAPSPLGLPPQHASGFNFCKMAIYWVDDGEGEVDKYLFCIEILTSDSLYRISNGQTNLFFHAFLWISVGRFCTLLRMSASVKRCYLFSSKYVLIPCGPDT